MSKICHYCHVKQCWLICTILLELPRGMASYLLLFILGALGYTTLIFGFPSLSSLRKYEGIMWLIGTIINLYYFSIFQYHNNNTTNINNINVHLTVIVSLGVRPLLAYDLCNLDVILLPVCWLGFLSPFCLTNLTTASLFL